MNTSEILNLVLEITKRPDKSAVTMAAINKVISDATILGDFAQDMIETTLAINPALYGDTISIAALTRFRRFTYVKPTGVKRYLKYLAPDKIFTPAGSIQTSIFYHAGTNMTYVLDQLVSALEVGYLTYPPILDLTSNTTHWMLDAIPYTIADLAAARVFFSSGDEVSASKYLALGNESYRAFRRDKHMGE